MNGARRDFLPPEGSTHELPEDDIQNFDSHQGQLKIFPDQSAVMIPMRGEEGMQHQQSLMQFDVNLAQYLPQDVLRTLGLEVKDAVDEDFKSQEPRIQAMTDFLPQLGLTLNQEGMLEGEFEHASSVYSPALFEASTTMLVNVCSSLYKEDNMVDTNVIGETNQELADQATRIKYGMNYYLTYDLKEFRPESRKTIWWSLLSGAAYKKVYIDPVKGKVVSMGIPIENFAIHSDHASHHSSRRKTQLEYLNKYEVIAKKKMGEYYTTSKRDITGDVTDMEGQELQDELAQISGVDIDDSGRDDNKVCIAEHHCYRYLKQDPMSMNYEMPSPYRIIINRQSGEIYGIYRNWREQDNFHAEKQWFVCFSCIPSLDGDGYGLVNTAGNLAKAATMVTRQLLNAGIYANFPAFIYQKGMRIEENNLRIPPGTGMGIATGGTPISDAIHPLPYKEPSPALFQLKENLEDAIKRPIAILSSKVEDMNPNAPVGTTLAMFETLQQVPNAILQGYFESLAEEFELIRERMYEWLQPDQQYPFKVPNQKMQPLMKNDFDGSVKIMPVGRAALHSSAYRLLRSEIILNAAFKDTTIHNMRAVYEQYYKSFNVPSEEIEAILLPAPQPTPPPPALDPTSENGLIMQGQPVKAYMWQDHDAHEAVHQLILQDQTQQQAWPGTMAHIQEHKAMKMAVQMFSALGMPVPEDPTQIPPEMQNQLAAQLAQVAMQMQQPQEQQQQQPLDPALVALEEVKMQGVISERRAETDMMRIETDREKNQHDAELKHQELTQKGEFDLLRIQLDTKKFELDRVSRERDMLLKEIGSMREGVNVGDNAGY